MTFLTICVLAFPKMASLYMLKRRNCALPFQNASASSKNSATNCANQRPVPCERPKSLAKTDAKSQNTGRVSMPGRCRANSWVKCTSRLTGALTVSLRTSNLSLLLVSLQSCRGSLCGGAHSDGAAASEIRKSTVWNANISSWNQHHEYWLHEAQKAHIPVLCFQETQISNISAPSAIAAARSAGYHMWLVPCPAHRKGGTAILVQQHLPVTCHQEVSNGGGQIGRAHV